MDMSALSPTDFAEAAKAAIESCAGLPLEDIARQMASAGISGVCVSEANGGLGLPTRYALPVLTAAGSALFAFPLMEVLLAAPALEEASPGLAASVASGDSLVTVAWSDDAEARRDGDIMRLKGVVSRAPFADKCTHVIVQLAGGGAVAVPTNLPGVSCEPMGGLDFERPSFLVRLDDVALKADFAISEERWEETESDSCLGRAALALGCADTSLALAEEHANTRRQFGRALSANQAVRHLLARQKLLLEGVRNLLARVGASDEVDALRKKACYLAAMEGGIYIVEKAIQLHGAMGYTWEVPLHRHLRWLRELQAQGKADDVMLSVADIVIAAAEPARPS